MLKLQFNNGETVTFDLVSKSGYRDWLKFKAGCGWLDSVTAIGVLQNSVFHTIPIPNNGIVVNGLGANIIKKGETVKGEMVWFKFDDYKMALTVYNGDAKVARIDVNKEKKPCQRILNTIP